MATSPANLYTVGSSNEAMWSVRLWVHSGLRLSFVADPKPRNLLARRLVLPCSFPVPSPDAPPPPAAPRRASAAAAAAAAAPVPVPVLTPVPAFAQAALPGATPAPRRSDAARSPAEAAPPPPLVTSARERREYKGRASTARPRREVEGRDSAAWARPRYWRRAARRRGSRPWRWRRWQRVLTCVHCLDRSTLVSRRSHPLDPAAGPQGNYSTTSATNWRRSPLASPLLLASPHLPTNVSSCYRPTAFLLHAGKERRATLGALGAGKSSGARANRVGRAAAAPAKGWCETRRPRPLASALCVLLPSTQLRSQRRTLPVCSSASAREQVCAGRPWQRALAGWHRYVPPRSVPGLAPIAYFCAVVHCGAVISASQFSLPLLAACLHDLRHETATLLYRKSPAIIYFPKPLEFLDLHFH